jgi:hypothetical protein
MAAQASRDDSPAGLQLTYPLRLACHPGGDADGQLLPSAPDPPPLARSQAAPRAGKGSVLRLSLI